MNKQKNRDIFNLFLILAAGIPLALYYIIHFYTLFAGKSLVGQNICLLIGLVFLWGVFDILYQYLSIIKEHGYLLRFKKEFSQEKEKELGQSYKGSIIGHRLGLISSLSSSHSEISHEVLTDLISVSESKRAIIPKYFLSVCVMLGLLGTFLGLLETVSGASLAIQMLTNADQLIKNLHQPINGMSLAFGTSVAGIVSSLSLGFAYLFLYQRQMTFLSDLEEFTQSALIPALSRSSGRVLEAILDQLQEIRIHTSQFSQLGLPIQSGVSNMLSSMAGHQKDLIENINQNLFDLFNIFSKENKEISKGFNRELQAMQELREAIKNRVKDQAESLKYQTEQGLTQLNQMLNEAAITQRQCFDEFMKKWAGEFHQTLEMERENKQLILEKTSYLGTLLEQSGLMIHSNQIEMQATLAMFVQGVDKLLEQFCRQPEEGEDQHNFLEKLELSLNLFHERAGSVLLEYTARSREIMAAILENQLHLNRQMQKLGGIEDNHGHQD